MAWLHTMLTVSGPAAIFGGVLALLYLMLVAVAALVGSLHPDPKRRADAQEVLGRLLDAVRRKRV